MSRGIRLASGDITAYALLNDDTTLVTNFTRQSDMTSGTQWLAVQKNPSALQQYRPSLEIGSGGYYGLFSGLISFFKMTKGMRQYIDTEILGGKPVATVTLTLNHPIYGFTVFTGELLTPYVANAQGNFERYDNKLYFDNEYVFQRGTRKQLKVLGVGDGSALGTGTTNNALAIED